ncbi:DAK2 domain-containing protein [Aerococcus urinae]|uniref:DAK2 domain-containing protein n=1 Tax=Aerococcus urinae TaxID=1376 RepID=UPI00227CDBD7|nr:DAK2 domain-containing protein [Aerococcus urinae]MCY3032749.1 DAK2 domain-containing protein [Aerococcus urinae]
MSQLVIDASELRNMVAVGCDKLKQGADYVDSLNVFPVPDGDTGTNMNLSFSAGLDGVEKNDGQSVEEVADALAKGLLMGARGNSGVILSQIFRGFAKGCKGLEKLDAKALANSFDQAVKSAYKAVMKPVEGTILTVVREGAEAGLVQAEKSDDVIEVMRAVSEGANLALENTPNLLPVLKEVGVVDSGGQGLCLIYAGFLEALTGEAVASFHTNVENTDLTELAHEENYYNTSHSVSSEDIKFGFCTEIMVALGQGSEDYEDFDYETFRNYLSERGDSLLVVNDDEVVKVHVHTERPGDVLNYGQKFGTLIKVKVDNMRQQHEDILTNKAKSAPKEKQAYSIIAVCAGEGVSELFKEAGASYIISGGQTMNPSTEDFVKAIEAVNAENIILLPNNKNIFMAAKQAADVSEVPTVVLETESITQGLVALLGFNLNDDLASNESSMKEAFHEVKSGQVTHAIRDTSISGLTIHKGDYMGLVEGDIQVCDKDKSQAARKTVQALTDEESELVTLIYGEDISEEEASQLADLITEDNDQLEVEVYKGDQPVYSYLISVE